MQRFGLLFKKHTSENYKSYLLSVGVLIGIMFLLMSFVTFKITGRIMNLNQQKVFYILFLFAAGTIFTSTVLANLGDKKKAIALLTLPATGMEKYLVSWLYSFVILLFAYTGIYYLVNTSVLHLFKQPGEEVKLFNIFAESNTFFQIFSSFAFLHSLAFLGSIWFEKTQFIKTAFIFLFFILILQLVNKQILQLLLGLELDSAVLFGDIAFLQNKERVIIKMPETYEYLLSLLLLVLGFILWTATYDRLKEKQV